MFVLSLFKRPFVVHAVVALLSLGVLLSQIGQSGVWDPYELDNAELGRRIEVHLFEKVDDPSYLPIFPKAHRSLAQPFDPPTIPTTSDLGMGELGFTSMAVAYRVFGWHDWVGRFALALWAWSGAMALYLLLFRLVDTRSAILGVLTLFTMPLFFMQARTMACDVVPIAAFSIATTGLALFLAERDAGIRVLALILGALGLVAGYLSRGLLIGAAVEWFHIALPLLDKSAPVKRAIGMTLYDPVPRDSTFDRILRQLGHALFPWSALMPFALGRLARPPASDTADGDDEGRGAFARLLLLSAAGVALLVTTAVVPYGGSVPYVGVAALAGAVALLLRDFERGAPHSRIIAVGTALLGTILFYDLKREPVRMLETFTAEGLTFPSSFAAESEHRLKIVSALFLGMTLVAFMDAPKTSEPIEWKESYFDVIRWWKAKREELEEVATSLGDAWNGNLVFVGVVLEAALIGLGAMLFIGSHGHWESIDKLPRNWVTRGLNLWWQVPIAIAAGSVGWVLARDAIDLGARALRSHRATFVAGAGVLAGLLLSFGYYPALARQLSPKEMFETFNAERAPNDELGLLGVSARAASFYWNGTPRTLNEPRDAFPWLVDPPENARRWLVFRARDLPKLNASYRAAYHANLPILDARSSQILLASTTLAGQPNENPFDGTILAKPPPIQHPVSARFTDEIEALGWDIENADGKRVTSVVAGKAYTMHFYYRALKPVGGNWQAFVHVDRPSLRHTADHPVLDGQYPMSLWQEGDIIKDTATLELDPSFLPGDYPLFFGFFNSSGRMRVSTGDAREDRVAGGTIVVR